MNQNLNINYNCKDFENKIFAWLDANEVFMVEPEEKKQAFYDKKRISVISVRNSSSSISSDSSLDLNEIPLTNSGSSSPSSASSRLSLGSSLLNRRKQNKNLTI